MAAPVLKKIHFCYIGGQAISKPLGMSAGMPAYQIMTDPASDAYFWLEYDQSLDTHIAHPSRMETRSLSTTILALVDVTEVLAGGSPYADLAAYISSNDWQTQDGTYSVIGQTKTSIDKLHWETASTINPTDLADPTILHSCLYFQVPPGGLKDGHIYNLFRVPNQIDNMSGEFEGTTSLQPGIMWDTAVYIDVNAPTITTKMPAPLATGVSVNSPIIIEFSEEVTIPTTATFGAPNDFNNWIDEPAVVTYTASPSRVTITPISPLPALSTINVHVPLGSVITDTSGNMLAPTSWSFTTGAVADTRVPIEAYAIGFTKDPDNFKSIPLTKSGTITQEFKIPAVDIDGPKIMYLRLRDQDGLISTNYRIALRVLDFELETFEVDTHGYCGGTTNQIDVLFDTDTDPTTMEYGYLIDDSGEPTVWNPVTPLSYDDVGKYKLNFNLDVSTISSGQHDLYVWLKTLEGEKKFCKTDFVSEPIPADPYGILTIKRSMIDGDKKKVWVEANVFDAGVGVSAISFVESINPASFESINIIQNKRITKLFEYDASANTTNTFNLIIEDAVGRTSALITTSIDLSGVY